MRPVVSRYVIWAAASHPAPKGVGSIAARPAARLWRERSSHPAPKGVGSIAAGCWSRTRSRQRWPSGPERGRLHCGAPAAERLAEALADHPAPKGVALIWWGRSTVAGRVVVDVKW